MKIVALSLLARPATWPFPDQIFGVERVSRQFLEGVGSSNRRNFAFEEHVVKVQCSALVRGKGKLDLF